MIALTLGVGLITTFSVVTASAKAVAFSQLDRDYPIDYLVSPLQTAGTRAGATLPDAVTLGLRRQPQLSTVAPRDFEPSGPVNVLIKAAPGAAAGQSLAAVDRALAGFPLTRVQSVADYKGQLTSAIDGLLAIFDGLLGIAIVIALFGIANTLSLSVIERTQESGLLRALGLTRGQLRRMLSAEALLIGVMGGAIGVVIGSGFGSALSETVVRAGGAGSSVSYPALTILLYVALAGLAGLAAGVLPARRAAKTSVIEAITRP